MHIPSITVDVVQGVGDIFWIVQQLKPHFQQINLNIMVTEQSVIQQRAQKFIQLIEGVNKVNCKLVAPQLYSHTAETRHRLQHLLDHPRKVFQYAVNKPLEVGIRLEAIDPPHPIAWGLPFKVPVEKKISGDYIVLYVSGSKNDMSWNTNKWFHFINALYLNYKLKHKLVLFGAGYDLKPLSELQPLLRAKGIDAHMMIDGTPEDAINAIRHAKLFIGYQSGMNILADNFDIPQIMFYFPYLRPMINTWCKPGHAEQKIFNGFTFDQHPGDIMRGCGDVCSRL